MKPFHTAAACAVFSVFAGDEPAVLPPYRVLEPLPAPRSSRVHPDSVRQSHMELSRLLGTQPGISVAARGPSGGEPVFRGLGWERVRTDFNGLSLHGACPARMDPPASLLSAASLQQVHLDLSGASVVDGPGGLGGRIRISTQTDWDPEAPRPPLLNAAVSVESNPERIGGNVSSLRESAKSSFFLSGSWSTQDDSIAGDGTRVPASRDLFELGLDGTLKVHEDVEVDAALRRIEERDVDYPALPMDSRHIDINIFTLNTRWQVDGETLKSLELRGGLQQVDHLMDNRDRPNRRNLIASNPTTADSYSGRLLSRWVAGEGELRMGADASRLEREATRRRFLPATGMSFRDPIWPDLRENQAGFFTEWEGPLREHLQLRSGIRLDIVNAKVGGPERITLPGPGVGPLTIEEAYTRFGEANRNRRANEDQLLSGNVTLEKQIRETWTATLGLIRVASAPNLSQRYDGFAARPGGYGIGNPDLDPEVKHQVELRLDGSREAHRFGVALHAARVDDYIKPTLIGRRDITGDGMPNPVFSHRNVNAHLYGIELAAVFRLSEHWHLPAQLGFVRGEESGGGDLPEMPPLEGSAALRWERRAHAELGVDFAARQERIDTGFGEGETPGYAVAYFRLGANLRPGLRIEAGIENLFDKTYARHLTRNAVMPVGDLRPGDRIPEPGRSFTLALRAQW